MLTTIKEWRDARCTMQRPDSGDTYQPTKYWVIKLSTAIPDMIQAQNTQCAIYEQYDTIPDSV